MFIIWISVLNLIVDLAILKAYKFNKAKCNNIAVHEDKFWQSPRIPLYQNSTISGLQVIALEEVAEGGLL